MKKLRSQTVLVVKDIIEWIDINIDNKITMDLVAAKAGYSKWYMQRLFRFVTNQTLGVYITQRRLYLASLDLLNSQDSILDIALKYGFESQQSFTRVFSRYFETPPGKWRKHELENSKSIPSGSNLRLQLLIYI